MYPSKSMLDYMTEMNRLFPRSNENDVFLSPVTPNASHQSLNQSSMARSSSSTDTSPDSFPDLTAHNFPLETFQHQYESQREHFDSHQLDQYDFRPQQNEYQRQEHRNESHLKPLEMQEIPFLPQQMYETPLVVRRQRPIVGRKIMAATESHTKNYEVSNVAWPEDSLPLTPPKTYTNQKFNQNMYYELFPAEQKEIEFKAPIKTSPNSYNTPPKMSNMSPRVTASPSMNLSPRMNASNPNISHRITEMSPNRTISPGSSASSYSPRFSSTFKEPILGPSTSFRPNMGPTKMCTFCRKNGETPLVYMTHTVKEKVGNKNIVTCPILRSHVCSTCGSSGDNAHTITYCPVLRSNNNGQPLQSTTITLKNTRVKSNGRRRY